MPKIKHTQKKQKNVASIELSTSSSQSYSDDESDVSRLGSSSDHRSRSRSPARRSESPDRSSNSAGLARDPPQPTRPGSCTDYWCYTLSNYTEDDVIYLRTLHLDGRNKVVYHIFQQEIAPETGTPHLQVINFSSD